MFQVNGFRDSVLYRTKDCEVFLYRKGNTSHGLTALRCRMKDCTATIKVLDLHAVNSDGSLGTVILADDEHYLHNHVGQDNIARTMDLKAACRKRAREESLPLKQIYDEECLR